MKNYSTSDKIAVILAWVLVHVIIGIAFLYIYNMCINTVAYISVFIANSFAHYRWSQKMSKETGKIFNF